MDASSLRRGFRLGEWLVEPRELRVTGQAGSLSLTQAQLDLLLALAERPGEAVSRRELRERIWPGQAGKDLLLGETARSLREALGGSARDRRYLVAVDRGGFALVARPGPMEPPAAAPASDDAPVAPVPPAPEPATRPVEPASDRSLHALFVELQRRNVLKVVGAYLFGMWLVLQVAETTFEPLHLPGS